MAAYTRCLRCAGAHRRPASGSGLSLLIPSWHAALSDLGEFDHRFGPEHQCRHWPSLWTKGLGTPNNPAIRFARGTVFAATLVRYCYGLSGCWPPCTDLTSLPANGGFYFQAFDGSVTLPSAGYNYNSVWTPLLTGLSPAGMAASLAALVLAAHAEDQVIAGEVDLDHHRPRAHLGEQSLHATFEGKRDAVADAARSGDLDGRADMKGKVGRRNKPEPQFARVQCDRHVVGQKADDLHVAGVVEARSEMVVGPDESERDDARFGADQRGRDGGLNEHLVGGIVAIDLENVTEGDAAAGLRVARIARERGRYLASRGRHAVARCRDAIAEPARLQRGQLGGIPGGFSHRLDEPLAILPTPRRA